MIADAEVSGKKHFIHLTGLGAASATSLNLFTPPGNAHKFVVKRASARFHAASSSGRAQLEVSGAGVAPGSGVNQLAAALDLQNPAIDTNTRQEAITSPTVIDNNSVLSLVLSGTLTSLANCSITIELERVDN